MSQILETLMLLSFGAAWPANLYKSYTSRTAKGKSLFFLIIIQIGYFFGIAAKIVGNNINYVLIFYLVNTVMVSLDVLLYFRNKKLDQAD